METEPIDEIHDPVGSAWKSNELILDAVFKFLNTYDLKAVRLTCRKFAVVGARALNRKSVMRLTATLPFAEKWPDSLVLSHCRNKLMDDFMEWDYDDNEPEGPTKNLWECICQLKHQKYTAIKSYWKYLGMRCFSSGFEPKNIFVYNCSDIWKLPLLDFEFIERLGVVYSTPCHAHLLLSEYQEFFPQLKSLEVRYYIPEEQELLGEGLHSLVRSGIIEDVEVRRFTRLEQLDIAVPANSDELDWSFLSKFRNLKKINFRWHGAYNDWHNRLLSWPVGMPSSYFNSDMFGKWLDAMEQVLNFSILTEISLRFDLGKQSMTCIQKALASATDVRKLSLQVRGTGSEVVRLLEGLDSRTMSALHHLHMAFGKGFEVPAGEVLNCLAKTGFFGKSAWEIVFRPARYVWRGWYRFKKDRSKLVLQTNRTWNTLFNVQKFRALFQRLEPYNYGFCHSFEGSVTGMNISEALGSEALVDSSFLSDMYLPAVNGVRRRPSKLLCGKLEDHKLKDYLVELCFSCSPLVRSRLSPVPAKSQSANSGQGTFG